MGILTNTADRARSSTDTAVPSLGDALFTSTQQRLFGLLFGQPQRSFYVTELIDLAQAGRGAVQRELARLERSGLISAERRGTQKHHRANENSPVFAELCSIVQKTVGLQEPIRHALKSIDAQISLALLFGSIAKKTDTGGSDIDLLVVSSDLTLEDLYSQLSPVEEQLHRRINPTLYTPTDFRDRQADGSPFLKRVLDGPVTVLIGEVDAA